MGLEKWIITPDESRVIDLAAVPKIKVGLVGGQVDIVAHDEPDIRIEVHSVTVKDLRIEVTADQVEISHARLRWDNFFEVFRNFGAGGPRAEISIAVPRTTGLSLGVVSASALIAGLAAPARLNAVSGDLIVDGLTGDVSVNSVSGDVQILGLEGSLNANSVSGDIAVTGTLRQATVDTVSGATLIDTTGAVDSLNVNTVSGTTTLRIDEGLAANYVARSVSGRVILDGQVRSGLGTGPGTNYAGSHGELSGTFVDVCVNSVSGGITVLRRAEAAEVTDEPAHTGQEW